MILLIHGIWFEEGLRFPMGMSCEGVTVFAQPTGSAYYFGAILQQKVSGAFQGVMSDTIGVSDISEVSFNGDELRFSKRYRHRGDVVHYTFMRKTEGGHQFIGYYEGWAVAQGWARCFVAEVENDFFSAPERSSNADRSGSQATERQSAPASSDETPPPDPQST